jgi:cytidine deaminase
MKLSVEVDVLKNSDRPDALQHLIACAIEAGKKAYAPYSDFKVGAAVLLENGEIIVGNNQENAAYPSGLCAERVAVFYAKANYPDVKIKQIAVIAIKEDQLLEPPVSPCGSCRQVLLEYEDQQAKEIQIILGGAQQTYLIEKTSDLLPLSFTGKQLKGL